MPRLIRTKSGIEFEAPDEWGDDEVRAEIVRRKQERLASPVAGARIGPMAPEPQSAIGKGLTGLVASKFPASMEPDIQQLGAGIEEQIPRTPADIVHSLPVILAAAAQGARAGTPTGALQTFLLSPGGRAMLGGIAGRTLQQPLEPLIGGQGPQGVPEALMQQLQSGATQTALAQGPVEIAQGLKPVARGFMRTALGAWGQKVARATGTALSLRIGPGFRWWKPIKQLDKLMEEGNALSNKMLQDAHRGGLWHDPRVMERGPNLRALMSDDALEAGERQTLDKWTSKFMEGRSLYKEGGTYKQIEHPNPISPITIDRLRAKLADLAKPILEARANKEYVPPLRKLRAQWADAMSRDLRDMLHNTEAHPNAIPGFTEIERKISDLINLRSAIRPVAKSAARSQKILPYVSTSTGALVGTLFPAHSWHERMAHAAAGAALTSPPGLSNMALLMSQPGMAQRIAALAQAGGAVADVTQAGPRLQKLTNPQMHP